MHIEDSYFSGFFDGEGAVSISNQLRPRATVTQKRADILKEYQKKFGGFIKLDKGGISHWYLTKTESIEIFLNIIYPYLFVKKEEVKLVLEFCKLIRRDNKGCNPLTKEEKDIRWTHRRKLQILRPNSNYIDSPTLSEIKRNSIKDKQNNKCLDCNIDLSGNLFGSIVNKDDVLRCRKCSAKKFGPNKIPKIKITYEQMIEAINSCNGNKAKAARSLGINKASFFYRLKVESKKRGLLFSVRNISNNQKINLPTPSS